MGETLLGEGSALGSAPLKHLLTPSRAPKTAWWGLGGLRCHGGLKSVRCCDNGHPRPWACASTEGVPREWGDIGLLREGRDTEVTRV